MYVHRSDMLKFKKKAGAHSTKEHSLFDEGTVPGSSVDGSKCHGVLHGEGVLVHELKDITKLVRLGCYGKGIFSRSVPSHQSLPQLSQLVRTSKRKRQNVGAGAVSGESSSATTAMTSTTVEGRRPEWSEQLTGFEEDERKRVALHSQWKCEQERLTQPCEGTDPNSGYQEALGQATKVVACESMPAVEVMSTEADRVKSDTEKPTELKLSEPESVYKDFVERIEELRKTDPFPIKEPLQLSCEEAIYLSVKLDILQVLEPDGRPATSETLWTHFCSTCGRFVERYTAYQYYRSKGWVPKSGLKFGVDFLLYKKGPSFYHSTYAVIVRWLATEQSQESLTSSSSDTPRSETDLTWREVISLDRVNEAAGKELIVCYVMKPAALSQDDLKLPSCVASLEVREMFIKRWVPERER